MNLTVGPTNSARQEQDLLYYIAIVYLPNCIEAIAGESDGSFILRIYSVAETTLRNATMEKNRTFIPNFNKGYSSNNKDRVHNEAAIPNP